MGGVHLNAYYDAAPTEAIDKFRSLALQIDHFALSDHENPVPWRLADLRAAGEFAKGRKYANLGPEPETGQLHMLPAMTVQRHARMQVTGEHVRVGLWDRMMGKGERAITVRCIDAADAELGWRISRAAIVVATNQQHLDVGLPRSPLRQLGEQLLMPAAAGMEEITEKDEPCRLGRLEHGVDPDQGAPGRTARNEEAGESKGRGLAEVRVGNEQGLARGPVDRLLGQQRQHFAGNNGVHLHILIGLASPSLPWFSAETRRNTRGAAERSP